MDAEIGMRPREGTLSQRAWPEAVQRAGAERCRRV